MISYTLKLSSLRSEVVKHRHISSRIFGVTHCYHQQKRNTHGSHTFRSYLRNPATGMQQFQVLNSSMQYTYLANLHLPMCIISFQQKRFTHNPPIPEECEPKKKSKGRFYIAATALLLSGIIGYAKYDDDFRKLLDENIPGSSDFIAVIFQEKKSFLTYISEGLDSLKDTAVDLINGTFGSKKDTEGDASAKASKTSKLPPCDQDMKPYKPPRSAFKPLVDDETKREEVKYTERRSLTPPKPPSEEVIITQEVIEEGEKSSTDADKLADHLVTSPRTLVELEETIGNHAQIAIKNYNDAICVLRDHAEEIYVLVESSVEKVDPKIWPQIKAKTEEKENLVIAAEMNAKVAEKSIERLKSYIDNPALNAPADMKERAKKNMQKVLADVAEARKSFEKERSKVSVTEKYWSKVEEARQHFSEELEILFPNVRLSEKQLKLAEGEIDLFILYAFQNILFYQKEVSKLETVGEMRIKQALEQSKSGDPNVIKSAVEAEIDKEKRNIQEQFQKRTLELKSECERDIRNQLKRQAQAHNDHLNEAIALKEKEVERKLQRKIEDRILDERTKYKEELAGMVARLKGFDEAIKKRADQDKYAQQSQVLWSACQTLLSSINSSDVSQPWSKQLKPLKDEVNAIAKAAEKDDLVSVIVSSIPEEALERGVYSMDALRERFLNVERVASVVAMVPEESPSLPVILLSYFQSMLIIKNPLPIPAHELANEPFDPSSLNTFDILQRARFWMDRGDIAQTLKYMNLLQGGARAVARDWIKEAQLMLETLQAATVLLTHASASGLVYS